MRRSRISSWWLACAALAASVAAQRPATGPERLPGPTYDGRDVQVVPRGERPGGRLGTRVAVVVGIDRYKYLSKLDYADRDAKDVAAALRALGFVVRLLTMDGEEAPANAVAVLGAIDASCAAADPQDTVLVFLSGHGFSEAGGKDAFFCAHYTDPDKLASTGLSLDEVRRRLLASKAHQKLLIVDACRNVPGGRSGGTRLEIAESFRAEGLGVLFSTAPGTLSYEPRGVERDAKGRSIGNGIFTHFLLRGLDGDADQNDDGWVTFRELAYYTWAQVKRQTELRQKPYLDWVGEAGGDILLRELPPPVADAGPKPPDGCRKLPDARLVDGVWDHIEDEASGVVFRWVPPGEFQMGSPAGEEGRDDNERQHRRVIRRGFYLGETEITVAQWRRFAQATGYRTDAERGGEVGDQKVGGYATKPDGSWEWHADARWSNPFPLLSDYRLDEQHPVVMVSWNDAVAFCKHYGLVLPSEAQWEWACRARATTRYPWGADEAGGVRFANVADQSAKRRFAGWTVFPFDDGHALLAPAGGYEANAFGLRDMIGNAWEWCADTYDKEYSGDGADETPATGGASRVLRGGSWSLNPRFCRSASRAGGGPANRIGDVGFRAARTR